MKRAQWLASAACVGALAVQLAAIITAPFTGRHELAWAPFHEQAWVRIEARVAGIALTEAELAARYHLRGPHWNESTKELWQLNELAQVHRVIEATESRLPSAEQAQVVVHATVNGVAVEAWRWPR